MSCEADPAGGGEDGTDSTSSRCNLEGVARVDMVLTKCCCHYEFDSKSRLLLEHMPYATDECCVRKDDNVVTMLVDLLE